MKTGILPAGGKSIRWDAYPKEFLPIGSAWTLLDRHLLLQTRALVDRVMLISSPEKLALHQWWIKHRGWPDVTIITANSVMHSILMGTLGMSKGDEFIFSMPDTYTDMPLFPEVIEKPLMLGVFETDESQRFGMVRGNAIVDKKEGKPGEAWGAFMFNDEVAAYWKQGRFKNHTTMLSAAMKKFEWGTWEIELYHDVADFHEYLKLLGGLHNAKKQSAIRSPGGQEVVLQTQQRPGSVSVTIPVPPTV